MTYVTILAELFCHASQLFCRTSRDWLCHLYRCIRQAQAPWHVSKDLLSYVVSDMLSYFVVYHKTNSVIMSCITRLSLSFRDVVLTGSVILSNMQKLA
jgi:hypothetical protein